MKFDIIVSMKRGGSFSKFFGLRGLFGVNPYKVIAIIAAVDYFVNVGLLSCGFALFNALTLGVVISVAIASLLMTGVNLFIMYKMVKKLEQEIEILEKAEPDPDWVEDLLEEDGECCDCDCDGYRCECEKNYEEEE